jgi:hypothetical protein
VHRLDDHGRGVEGGEGGALRAGVVLGREQCSQLLPQRLPGGVSILAGDRVGEDPQGDRAEAGKAQKDLALVRRGGPLGLLDSLKRTDGRQESAGFRFVAADSVGRGGALRQRWVLRHGTMAGESLVEVDVVDHGWVWYGREGHGASPV